MNNQIYLIQPGKAYVPARIDVFKYGGGIRLSISAGPIHAALVAEASAMAAELERAAGLIRQAIATNDQAHISRHPNPAPATEPASTRRIAIADLNGDPAHDWPLFVERFHASPARDVLPAVAEMYKKQYGYTPPNIENVLDAGERIELDFEPVRPYLADIVEADGSLRRGARARIAEALGIRDAGNYRARIDAVLEFISNADPVELLGSWVAKSNESNTVLEARAVGE